MTNVAVPRGNYREGNDSTFSSSYWIPLTAAGSFSAEENDPDTGDRLGRPRLPVHALYGHAHSEDKDRVQGMIIDHGSDRYREHTGFAYPCGDGTYSFQVIWTKMVPMA